MSTGNSSSAGAERSTDSRLRVATLAILVSVNLLLVVASLFALRQNVRLRNELAYDDALLTPANGSVVPPLAGQDLTGAPQTIAYGQDPRPTLIYTFSQRCGYCSENWRAMRSFQAFAPHRLRIVYVDVQGDLFTPEYLAVHGMEQSLLLSRLSPSIAYVYNARAVPQALLVDHHGHVQWSRVGELAPSDISRAVALIAHD